MRRPTAVVLAASALILLAACSSGSSSPTAAASTPEAASPATSEAPGGSPAAGGGCATSTDAATVTVDIADFAFAPAEAEAPIGSVVGWTNSDSAAHTATLDDGSCDTGSIASGEAGALVFNTAGTFAYHCAIHPNMTASITITE